LTVPIAPLRSFSDASLRADSVEALVDAFLAIARELVGVDQVHLIEVSQDAAVGHARVVAYEAGGRREDAYVMVLDERPSGTTQAVQTRKPVLITDARSATTIRPDFTERFAARSVMFVPVMWSGDVRWVVNLIRTGEDAFAETDVEVAQLLANLTAAGLALLEGRDTAGSRQDQDAAFARAAHALNVGGEQNTVLEAMTREADIAIGGDIAGVYLGDAVNGGRGTAGHNSPPEWYGYVIRPGEGVGGQVLATGLPVIANSYQQDVRVPDSAVLSGLQTAVAVPITVAGEVRGALSIGFEHMRRITRRDLTTLEAFADLAAIALR
jgi:GAF domain-containing protein